ncbi:hypothetical protein K474DRAFT_1673072 [Panus rudis PR-1116 ss-1]|nr:hypothetical protein K474DRAFT_1673072 [Panus rudis PR-1116 ss-1]
MPVHRTERRGAEALRGSTPYTSSTLSLDAPDVFQSISSSSLPEKLRTRPAPDPRLFGLLAEYAIQHPLWEEVQNIAATSVFEAASHSMRRGAAKKSKKGSDIPPNQKGTRPRSSHTAQCSTHDPQLKRSLLQCNSPASLTVPVQHTEPTHTPVADASGSSNGVPLSTPVRLGNHVKWKAGFPQIEEELGAMETSLLVEELLSESLCFYLPAVELP